MTRETGTAWIHAIQGKKMTKIVFLSADGATRTQVEADNGSSVMEAAVRNGIPGIDAECGGACACATCHVYVDEEWTAIVGAPDPMEEDMLDFASDVRPNSRLSCQIRVTTNWTDWWCRCRNGRADTIIIWDYGRGSEPIFSRRLVRSRAKRLSKLTDSARSK